MKQNGKKSGITLVEMLAVVGIMLILIALLITVGTLWRAKTLQQLAIAEIKGMQLGLERFHQDHHRYPNFADDGSSAPLVAALGGEGLYAFPAQRLIGLAAPDWREVEQIQARLGDLITVSLDDILGNSFDDGLRGRLQGLTLDEQNVRKPTQLMVDLLKLRFGSDRLNTPGYCNDPHFSYYQLNSDGTLYDREQLIGDKEAAAGFLLYQLRKIFLDPPPGVDPREMAAWSPDQWNALIEEELGAGWRLDAAGAERADSFAGLDASLSHQDWLQHWRDYFHTDGIFSDTDPAGYGRTAIESAFGDHADWFAAYTDFGKGVNRGGVHADMIYSRDYQYLENLGQLGNMISAMDQDIANGVYGGDDLADINAARDRLQDIYDHVLAEVTNGQATDFADRENFDRDDVLARADALETWLNEGFPVMLSDYRKEGLTGTSDPSLDLLRRELFGADSKSASRVGDEINKLVEQVHRMDILLAGVNDPDQAAELIGLLTDGHELQDLIASSQSEASLLQSQIASRQSALGLDDNAGATAATGYFSPRNEDAIWQRAADEVYVNTLGGYSIHSLADELVDFADLAGDQGLTRFFETQDGAYVFDQSTRDVIAQQLQTLTGQDFGYDQSAWESWLESSANKYNIPVPPLADGTVPAGVDITSIRTFASLGESGITDLLTTGTAEEQAWARSILMELTQQDQPSWTEAEWESYIAGRGATNISTSYYEGVQSGGQTAADQALNEIIGWDPATDTLEERLVRMQALGDDLTHAIAQAMIADSDILTAAIRENFVFHVQHNPGWEEEYIVEYGTLTQEQADRANFDEITSLAAEHRAYPISGVMSSMHAGRNTMDVEDIDPLEMNLAMMDFIQGYADEVDSVYYTVSYELFGDPDGTSEDSRERLDTFAYGCARWVIEQIYRGNNPAVRSLFDQLEYLAGEIHQTHQAYEAAGGANDVDEYLPLNNETDYYDLVRDWYFGNEDGTAHYDGYSGGTYTDDRFANGTDSGYLRNEDGSLDDRLQHLNVGGAYDPGNAPIVSAGGPYLAVVGEPVRLAGTYRAESPLDTAVWDYDDGSAPGYNLTSSHIFTEPGNYSVTLTITDEDGNQYERLATVAVYDADYGQQRAEAGGPYYTRQGDSVTLTGSYVGPGADGADYRWAVDVNGDGDFSDPGEQNYAVGPRPTVSFPAPGDYAVEVQVRPEGAADYSVTDRGEVSVYEQSAEELARQLEDLYDQFAAVQNQLGAYTKQLNDIEARYQNITGESQLGDSVTPGTAGQEFLDPWGNPYRYLDPAGTAYEEEGVYYLIISGGPDGSLFVETGELDDDPGTSGVPDDIVNGLPIAEKLKRAMTSN